MTDSPTSDHTSQENCAQSRSAPDGSANGSSSHSVAPIFTVVKGNPSATEIAAIQLALDTLQAEAKQRYKATERNQWGGVEETLNQIARQVFNPNAYSTSVYR